jgi:hypothetical protein
MLRRRAWRWRSGPPVVVTSITPTHGPDTGGTAVVIAGSGFTGATRVRFSLSSDPSDPGTDVSFTFVSDNEIDTTTPPGIATFSYHVHVYAPGGVGSGHFGYDVSGTWAPTDASVPLLAWYLPSYATADLIDGLTHVTRLYDQSGNGDANRDQVRAAVGQEPNYTNSDADYGGQPSISGDGTRGLLSVGAWSTAPGAPITIVVVGKASANVAYLSGINAAGNLLWQFGASAQYYNGPSVSASNPTSTPAVLMFEDDGATSGLFLDDLTTPAGSSGSVVTADTGYNLMTGDAGVGPLNGSMAEVMIFAGILSPTDRANLAAYLNTTRAYGIPVTV